MIKLTDIGEIDRKYISELLSHLLRNNIYRSEAQLQFEIAWQLKQDLSNLTDWEILLEPLSATIDVGEDKKRIYADIFIYNGETGEFIPIELKYKTKEIKDTYILKNHGAQDLGAYDFLWDVKRIEILKNQTSLTPKGKTCIREPDFSKFLVGFSLLVTNDTSYSETHLKSCAREFFFPNGKTFTAGVKIDWDRTNSSSFYKNSWRNEALCFDNSYMCNWITVTSPSPYSVDFQFLVFEIQ